MDQSNLFQMAKKRLCNCFKAIINRSNMKKKLIKAKFILCFFDMNLLLMSLLCFYRSLGIVVVGKYGKTVMENYFLFNFWRFVKNLLGKISSVTWRNHFINLLNWPFFRNSKYWRVPVGFVSCPLFFRKPWFVGHR